MKLSIESIIKKYQQTEERFLLLDQTPTKVVFSILNPKLKKALMNLENGGSLLTDSSETREWTILFSAITGGFEIYVDAIQRFRKDGNGKIINSTEPWSTAFGKGYIQVEPQSLFLYGSDYFAGVDYQYRFLLHPDLHPIIPEIWRCYGLSEKLLGKLIVENPAVNEAKQSAMIGCATKTEVLKKLYPEARLFDGIEDLHFDLACFVAEVQPYIVPENLDEFIEAVACDYKKYLPVYSPCKVRSRYYKLACFLEQVYQIRQLKDRYDFILDGTNPETGEAIREYFTKQMDYRKKISFTASLDEMKQAKPELYEEGYVPDPLPF